jgi:hypothetical protein
MMANTSISVTSGQWSVSFRPTDSDERIVQLNIRNMKVTLPAIEAHKLGSALRIASGLEGET